MEQEGAALLSLLKKHEFIWLHCKQIPQLLFCCIPAVTKATTGVAKSGLITTLMFLFFSNPKTSPAWQNDAWTSHGRS